MGIIVKNSAGWRIGKMYVNHFVLDKDGSISRRTDGEPVIGGEIILESLPLDGRLFFAADEDDDEDT